MCGVSIGCNKKGFGIGATKSGALSSSLQIIFSIKNPFGFMTSEFCRSIAPEILCLSRLLRVSAKSEGASDYTYSFQEFKNQLLISLQYRNIPANKLQKF